MIRAIGTLVLLASCAVCRAQESGWMPGDGIPGVYGNVYAVTSWDPDGAEGPSPELLVIGGEFSQAGDTLASNIVMWDGERWRTFSGTIEGRVHALAVFRDTLYAAGTFPGGLVRWTGVAWEALPDYIHGTVECLLATEAGLYVGGAFKTLDFLPASSVAVWSGSSWSPPGQGVEFNVWAMTEHNGDVYVGGGMGALRSSSGPGKVSKWEGSTWTSIEPVFLSRPPNSLASFAGSLYVAVSGAVSAPGIGLGSIVRWDGQAWSGVPGSLQNAMTTLMPTPAGLLAAIDSGRVTLSDGTFSTGANVWDGSAWLPLPGFSPYSIPNRLLPTCLWNDAIVLGGASMSLNGACSKEVQIWNGAAWKYPGDALCGTVSGLYLLDDTLVATTLWTFDGNEYLRSPMYREGTAWNSIAPECASAATAKPTVYNGELYFSASRQSPPLGYHIHAWNGQSLRVVAPGQANPIAFYRGDLHGVFSDGSTSAVKKWDGGAWVTLPGQGASGTLPDLRVFGDTLLAFTRTSQSVTVRSWDGVAWTQMGQPLQRDLLAVLVANGTVYVSTSGGQDAATFSRWNGAAWESAGFPGGTVWAVAEFQGEIIASCRTFPGIIPQTWGLYRVTDDLWPLWEGTRPTSVTSMVVRRGELTVTGEPYLVNGVSLSRIARWGDGLPLIQHEPVDLAACLERTTTLEVDVSGTARLPVTYQWFKDGQPLANGLTPHGSRLWGTNEFRLLIGNTTLADAGTYTCRISTARGEVQTTPAEVTVGWQGCCDPDFNCDSTLDAADLACLEAAIGGDTSCSCGRDPDFNLDFSLDGFDVEALAAVLNGGACP